LRLRRVVLSGFALLAPLLAVAAVAWACNPQAHLSVDKDTFAAGSAITVVGSYFPGNATITVSGSWGPPPMTVQTSAGGGFVTQVTAPGTPGNYNIAATRPTGGFAVVAFTVVPPSSALPPPPPAVAPAPAGPDTMVPSPLLAPALAGPKILRPARANEVVLVSRAGSLKLFCGRFELAGVTGTCGAMSTRAAAPLELRPKAFRAGAVGMGVRVRFYVSARVRKRIRAARRIRMRGTVVAMAATGSKTTATFAFTLKAARPATPPPR
jgi:hypothetical protein